MSEMKKSKNSQVGSVSWRMNAYSEELKRLATQRMEIQRLRESLGTPRLKFDLAGQVEPFLLKPKEKIVEYKFFSPLGCPVTSKGYSERYIYQAKNEDLISIDSSYRWVWVEYYATGESYWGTVTKSQYPEEENEFGVISP